MKAPSWSLPALDLPFVLADNRRDRWFLAGEIRARMTSREWRVVAGPVALSITMIAPASDAEASNGWDVRTWGAARLGDVVAAHLVGTVLRHPGQVARVTVETRAETGPVARARTVIGIEALSAQGAAGEA
jgi:hypothetical protein